ncbi:MAG: chromosome segregation SMC family protein [Candidatus Bathyarchaeia archaeon]
MPYIKRIEIDGFKTFGLKTVLTFDRGFTIITGPNGSGKTNIIDAVLFCLGELSAKRLRVENFSNLIFNGGEKSGIRKNTAKVVIQFDNSEGRIPVETTTVTIAREIDKNGESVYRINGRRVPRAHLLEVLSVAGITPYGHNIVLQGTLTRMAEISTIERRKIIEDMLGIAQYDAGKADAEQKLKEADVAIRAALGQISEVQRRVESLERERNNLLRYNLLKKEMMRLESMKISLNIRDLEAESKGLLEELSKAEEKSKWLFERRESLRAKRRELESELRKLGFSAIQEKNAQMVEIEVNIRSLKSRLNEILSKISGGQSSLSKLGGLQKDLKQQIESLKSEIERSEEKISQLTLLLGQLGKELEEKQSIYDSISKDLSEVRSIFEEKARRISEIEERIGKIQKERIDLEGERARLHSEISIYLQRLKDLENKKGELQSSYERIRELLAGLDEVAGAQRKRIEDLKSTLERRVKRRSSIEEETKEVERIAEVAREALIKFEVQKNLVKKIKSEEIALKHLEELGAKGVIGGVYGRLRNLIKVDGDYIRAVEAAASGWLDSLVVEDLNVAFVCIETLRRMKIGRIKIIPLRNLSPNSAGRAVNIDGVYGWISSLVQCEERYRPAVEFVLGDTLLALSEEVAIKASKDGFRAVTIDGNLYEAWGGIESGFYRRYIDLSSFIPGDEALKSLDKAVSALRKYLDNRENIITELEAEISKTQNEIMALSESLARVEGEIDRVKRSLSQADAQIKRLESTIGDLTSRIRNGREKVASIEERLNELESAEKPLKDEHERLRSEIDLLSLHDKDKRRSEIIQEIIHLKQRYNNVESELVMTKAKVEGVLKRNMETLMAQLNEISKQIINLEGELEEALKEEGEIRKKIEELERARETLSREIGEAKDKMGIFVSQIDSLEMEISNLDMEYDREIKAINDLKIKIQSVVLQASRLRERLRELGHEELLEVQGGLPENELDSWLKAVEEELKHIGAVNQLAESQYIEEVSRYKEVSTRLNNLEKEREAILKFIDEIEQKKIRIFMEAFNRISERVSSYFSRLTGGGSAYLKLENQEDPFAGGVDIIVQFPSKSPIPVSGASSGERSVSAVAFLLALQEFSPASFYLFDEIDAHLDAFHVERLGDLLTKEAADRQLQFIVITLKPEMISKANKVYGVYGQSGVSHVVSMTLKGVIVNE